MKTTNKFTFPYLQNDTSNTCIGLIPAEQERPQDRWSISKIGDPLKMSKKCEVFTGLTHVNHENLVMLVFERQVLVGGIVYEKTALKNLVRKKS